MKKNQHISVASVASLCLASAEKYNKRIAIEIYRQGKICCLTSYRLLGIRQRQFALLLDSLGVKAGSRVLLLAENRPEWAAMWFGIALAGAACVPVAPDSPPELINHICANAGLSAICVSRRHASAFIGAEKRAPFDLPIDHSTDFSTEHSSKHSIDPSIPLIIIDSIRAAEPEQQASPVRAEKTVISVALNGISTELPLEEPENAAHFPPARPDEPAAVFYSSAGAVAESVRETTVTGRQFLESAASGRVTIFPRDRLLSTISLANSFELSCGLLRAVAAGSLTIYPDEELSPQQLCTAAGALKPTIILALPGMVMEFRKKFIEPLLKTDPFYRHAMTKTLAYRRAGKKLLSALGKIIRHLEIGGDLPDDTKEFLCRIKFPYSCSSESGSGWGLSVSR